MNKRILELAEQAGSTHKLNTHKLNLGVYQFYTDELEKFVELIIANTAELKPVTDPINKPFELNPKFTSKCDAIGRSRRQFQ